MKYKILLILGFGFCLFACASKKVIESIGPKYIIDQEIKINVEDTIFIDGSLSFAGTDKLAIFIAGSGPTDRDCNSLSGLKTDAFKQLAEILKAKNISSYRYDKRGIGSSTKVSESTMEIQDFISDASTIVDYFANDFSEVYVIGHSEGALIGSVVSHSNDHVKGFISLSGISESLDNIVLTQLSKYPILHELAIVHIEEIKNDKPLSEVNPMLVSLFRDSLVPFLKSIFMMDPIAEISKINKDVLIIGGSCDQQVSVNHAENLHKALPESQLLIIKNMGHTLKNVGPDCSRDTESYTNPDIRIHQDLFNGIDDFINKQ